VLFRGEFEIEGHEALDVFLLHHMVRAMRRLGLITRQEMEAIMADITSAVSALIDAVAGVATRVTADLAALHDQISALEAGQTDASAVHAAVDAIQSAVTTLNSIDPAPEPASGEQPQ
jgi:hypothetical protein